MAGDEDAGEEEVGGPADRQLANQELENVHETSEEEEIDTGFMECLCKTKLN